MKRTKGDIWERHKYKILRLDRQGYQPTEIAQILFASKLNHKKIWKLLQGWKKH